MKRIALLVAALPGTAIAHGVHAPVADHVAAHLSPAAGLGMILVALCVAAARKSRRARE